MTAENSEKLQIACRLMDEFARRTGLKEKEGDPRKRYLWTDAFAVQALLGLNKATNVAFYKDRAFDLIEKVHHILGRHRPDDPREGWISGLPEKKGEEHPTAGGLRIGKQLPERKEGQARDERLEWERDGQYFHYLSRWINALLEAYENSGEGMYARQAAELAAVTRKFIYKNGSLRRMYWKMSIDLSRPLVESMGAHDPLEALVCVIASERAAPAASTGLEPLKKDLVLMCRGRSWATTDPLGLGGLLLNLVRVAKFAKAGLRLPDPILPRKMLAEGMDSLEAVRRGRMLDGDASGRLAFRECGLALGLRVSTLLDDWEGSLQIDFSALDRYRYMAEEVENYWALPSHQKLPSWTMHLDINAVSLASSLVARHEPSSFG